MSSALMGVGFPEEELVFPGELRPDPEGGVDENGNPRFIRDDVTVRVKLKATSNGQIIELVGIDSGHLALEGICLDPVRLPGGISPGSEAPFTIDGTPGVIRILPWYAGQHEAGIAAVGQKIGLEWRPV